MYILVYIQLCLSIFILSQVLIQNNINLKTQTEEYKKMSEKGSDSQQPQRQKLDICKQQPNQGNSNLFSYENQSDNASSNEDGNQIQNQNKLYNKKSERSDDGDEFVKAGSNKLSDMLSFDDDNIEAMRNSNIDGRASDVVTQFQDVDAHSNAVFGKLNQQQQKNIKKSEKLQNHDQKLQNNGQNQQKNNKKQTQQSGQVQIKQQIKQCNIIEDDKKENDKNFKQPRQQQTKNQSTAQENVNNVITQVKMQDNQIIDSKVKNQMKSDDHKSQKIQNILHSSKNQQNNDSTQNRKNQDTIQVKNQKQKTLDKQLKNQLSAQKTQQKKQEMQEKYKKQLELQMLQLKKGVDKKKKTSQKQKQSEKNKLNKTLIPTTSIFKSISFQETAETRAEELKMISTMALEKKKENYHLLKQWDKRRAQSLAIHGNMIEILQTEIDKRIKSSIENIQIYSNFLRQKIKQQQKFISHPIINTKYALQNNSISKNIYLNCTVILNSLTDQNTAKCRKVNDFIQIIKNDILRDSIQTHLQQSQKQLLGVRKNISNLKVALRKFNSETEQKTSQLALFFNQNAVNMNVDGQKDFYSTQIQFLQKAAQQTSTQKKLGQCCLQYLKTAIQQQIKRSKVIRDAMITFSKALEQCYNIQTDPAEIQQLSKAEQNKLIQQFYSLEQIFDERCLTVFKTYQHMQPTKMLNIEIFSNFLKKFDFEGFDCKIVLLKEYNVKYHAGSKSQQQKQQSCYLVITVDKFLHLFLGKQKTDPYIKPDISIKATLKNLQLRPIKGQMLDIVIKDEKKGSMISYFWETRNDRSYRVEFQKKDTREQFIDYVMKIRG